MQVVLKLVIMLKLEDKHISGHLIIGDNVTIAAKSGVTKNILDNKIVAGFPAKDIKLWKKEIIKNSIKK